VTVTVALARLALQAPPPGAPQKPRPRLAARQGAMRRGRSHQGRGWCNCHGRCRHGHRRRRRRNSWERWALREVVQRDVACCSTILAASDRAKAENKTRNSDFRLRMSSQANLKPHQKPKCGLRLGHHARGRLRDLGEPKLATEPRVYSIRVCHCCSRLLET